MLYNEAITLITYIRAQDYTPTDWETNFMQSIELEAREVITYKQMLALQRIYAKATGGGKYERRQRR